MVDSLFMAISANRTLTGDREHPSHNPSHHNSSHDLWLQPPSDGELLHQFGFLPGFQELLMVRQVHALEHATVWVLSEQSPAVQSGARSEQANTADNLLGGMSTDRGFYLYGQVSAEHLWQAVHEARSRLVAGEWHLAVHPRCGTNLSVSMLLTAGFALGAHIMLPKNPIAQLVGLGVAATVATQLTPDLGSMAQQYVTTAIPFNIAIDRITSSRDRGGCPVHFVHLRWRS